MKTIAFQTRLESDTVHLANVDNLIGKDVIITVIEVKKGNKTRKRRWNHLGDADFHKKMDKVNIRDFANG